MYWPYQNDGDIKPKVDGVHLPPRGKSKSFEYNGQFIRKSIYFQQTRNKWVVQWQFANGHRRTQTFNCNTLGRDEALRLAEAITPESIPPEPSPRDNPYLVARKRNRDGVPGIYDQNAMNAHMMRGGFPGLADPNFFQQQLLMNPWANLQMLGMDPSMAATLAAAGGATGSTDPTAAAAAAAAASGMDTNAITAAALAAAGGASADDPTAAAFMNFPFFPNINMFGTLPDPNTLNALSMLMPNMFDPMAAAGQAPHFNVAGSEPAAAASTTNPSISALPAGENNLTGASNTVAINELVPSSMSDAAAPVSLAAAAPAEGETSEETSGVTTEAVATETASEQQQ